MAITLNNRPSVITPGFNQMMFKATSTQTAQPNFKYYIQINVDGNVLSPLVLPARPTADVIFDIQPLVQDYLKNYFPINTHGWQQCTKSIINVTVNIGERYGTTPTIYAGTTETYKPYYASLSNEKMAVYISTAYSFISGALNGYGSTIRATTTGRIPIKTLFTISLSLKLLKNIAINSIITKEGSAVPVAAIMLPFTPLSL
jgi:hypothetical protein